MNCYTHLSFLFAVCHNCPHATDLMCGSDNVTYDSACHLAQADCRAKGANSTAEIAFISFGECGQTEGKLYVQCV